MINATKVNLFLLPLLVSILLSIAGKLKVGRSLDSFFYTIVSPITSPVSQLHILLENKYSFVTSISSIEEERLNQKKQIAGLLSENEYLKQSLKDQKILGNLNHTFTEVLPVRLSGSTGVFLISSSQPLDTVRPGQPLVSGNVILGVVKEIKGSVAVITPLNSEKSSSFHIRTASGHKGLYKHDSDNPQIVDVPSQTPLILGDYIFTEPGEFFPGNLIVGKITRLLTISQEPLQKAEIELFDNLDNAPDNLAIITKP